MAVVITDSLVTLEEVMLYQGKSMNTISDSTGSTRLYSDDLLSTIINNVIRFVLGNAPSDVNTNIKLFAIIELSAKELDNRLITDGYIPNRYSGKNTYDLYDTFNKENLLKMIEVKSQDADNTVEIVPYGIRDYEYDKYKYAINRSWRGRY